MKIFSLLKCARWLVGNFKDCFVRTAIMGCLGDKFVCFSPKSYLKQNNSKLLQAIYSTISQPLSCTIQECIRVHSSRISRSRDKWLSFTQSQAEHCNGLRDIRVLQARDISPVGSVQEKNWSSSCEDALFTNKLLFWKVNFNAQAMNTVETGAYDLGKLFEI